MSCCCIHGNKPNKTKKYVPLTLDKKKELIAGMTGLSFNYKGETFKIPNYEITKSSTPSKTIMPNHASPNVQIVGGKVSNGPTILSLLQYKGGYWICTDGRHFIDQYSAYFHQLQIGYNFQGSVEKPMKPSPSPEPEPTPTPTPPEPEPEPTPTPDPPTPPEPEPKHYSSFRFDGMLDRNYMSQHKIQTYRWLIEPFIMGF